MYTCLIYYSLEHRDRGQFALKAIFTSSKHSAQLSRCMFILLLSCRRDKSEIPFWLRGLLARGEPTCAAEQIGDDRGTKNDTFADPGVSNAKKSSIAAISGYADRASKPSPKLIRHASLRPGRRLTSFVRWRTDFPAGHRERDASSLWAPLPKCAAVPMYLALCRLLN